MKNKLHYTFFLAFLVTFGLIVLHYLPEIKVGGKSLRKVDLLSDIRSEVSDSDTISVDTLPPLPVVKPAFVD